MEAEECCGTPRGGGKGEKIGTATSIGSLVLWVRFIFSARVDIGYGGKRD